MTEIEYEDRYEPTPPADRYQLAWRNARARARVLSAELTRRAPLLGEYAEENTKLHQWHDEDRDALTEMRGTIERLRAKKQDLGELAARRESELIHYRAQRRAVPPAPADRGAPGMYYCDDCDHAFTAPTDAESCICSCGTRAWRETPAGADLRDRIAVALDAAFESFDPERTEDAELSGHLADAVLVILPAPADRATLKPMFEGLARLLATSSRDWGTYRVDAWLYAVLVGWDCEQTEHDETCVHGAMEETAQRHGWDAGTVAKARRYRAAVRRTADEAQRATVCDHDSQVIEHEGGYYWACLKCGKNHGRVAADQADRVLDERVAAAKEQPVEAGEVAHRPCRGDEFERWLKAQRDAAADYPQAYQAADGLLDLYRLHADTGTLLDQHVCEGQVIGDCDCLEQPADEARQADAAGEA